MGLGSLGGRTVSRLAPRDEADRHSPNRDVPQDRTPRRAEFHDHRIKALVRADNGHEGYLAIVAEGIPDPRLFALLLDCVPGVAPENWQPEPSPLAEMEPARRVHGVPAGTKLLGERAHPVGESLDVVKQHNFGHLYTPIIGRHYPNDP